MSVVNTLPSGKRFPFLELPNKSLWVNFNLLARDMAEKKKSRSSDQHPTQSLLSSSQPFVQILGLSIWLRSVACYDILKKNGYFCAGNNVNETAGDAFSLSFYVEVKRATEIAYIAVFLLL